MYPHHQSQKMSVADVEEPATKKCKLNLWDESEMVWCLQEYNRQLVIFSSKKKKRVASVHVAPTTNCSFWTFWTPNLITRPNLLLWIDSKIFSRPFHICQTTCTHSAQFAAMALANRQVLGFSTKKDKIANWKMSLHV